MRGRDKGCTPVSPAGRQPGRHAARPSRPRHAHGNTSFVTPPAGPQDAGNLIDHSFPRARFPRLPRGGPAGGGRKWHSQNRIKTLCQKRNIVCVDNPEIKVTEFRLKYICMCVCLFFTCKTSTAVPICWQGLCIQPAQ